MDIGEQVAPPGATASLPKAASQITVIAPTTGWSALRLHEVWEYRDLLYTMTWRDLQARYRQMALGPLWIVLQPLLSMVLYSLLFGGIAGLPSDGQPYAVFTFAALLPWGLFSDAVSAGANSLLANRQLISKIYFPRLIPAFARFLSNLVDFSVAFIILLILLALFRVRPNMGIVLLPVFMLVAGIAGLGVGFMFAGIVVHYRDFGQVLGVLVRFWMYATPVVYSISLVPEQWLWLYRLNPMTGVVEGFRWALLDTSSPPDLTLAISAVTATLLFISGLYMFKRVERSIVDVA